MDIQELVNGLFSDLSDIDIDMINTKFNTYKVESMSWKESMSLYADICEESFMDSEEYDIACTRILYEIVNHENNENGLGTFVARQVYIHENLANFMDPKYIEFIVENARQINEIYDKYSSIPLFLRLFGFKTLQGSYCIQVNGVCVENPMDVFMRTATDTERVSIIQPNAFERIEQSMYNFHRGLCVHATPTLYNSGTNNRQLSSCFLIGMDDSIEGIYSCNTHSALISKKCGGVGMSASNVRASGSKIVSSNGESSSLVTMLQVFNYTARYVNQGGRGSKRKGAFAVFLETWHADIEDFIKARLANGAPEMLLRDLFIGMWIPDLFMKKLITDDDWYLMSPDECPNLYDVYGDEFEALYEKYVSEGKYRKVVKPSYIMDLIYKTIKESGQPYMLFKDKVNRSSNQSNIGTVRCSNLCCEIMEVSSLDKHAVCNLASICVNRFYNTETNVYDYDGLVNISRHLTRSLTQVIDNNRYPTEESMVTNYDNYPIGIGIQGVADMLMDMRLPYESDEAIRVEEMVMEAIYYGALSESCQMAKENGHYKNFPGSPFSEGKLQFDLGYKPSTNQQYNWDELKENIKEFGTANSLLVALPPTASTSQIMGNNECFEPITNNCYLRNTAYGSFKVINYRLVRDLKRLGIWNDEMKDILIDSKGSVQNIDGIPSDIKELYKNVWEMKQKSIMDHAIARAKYVDQSQSMNVYFPEVKYDKFVKAMMYAWKNGLKTGSYYTRSLAKHDSTDRVSKEKTSKIVKKEVEEVCTMCSA